jgi:hypothetical protein
MSWDRIHRMELEAARLRADIDAVEAQVADLRAERARLIESRDLARRVAMRLEEENHLLASASPVCAICQGVVTPVRVKGTAS